MQLVAAWTISMIFGVVDALQMDGRDPEVAVQVGVVVDGRLPLL
jgi:hypothetical protein